MMPTRHALGWAQSPLAALALNAALYAVHAAGSFDSDLSRLASSKLPSQAQIIDHASFASLQSVPPFDVANGSTIFVPPGTTLDSLKDSPFHIFHPDFLGIIGSNPTLTLIHEEETDPIFHEAPVWYPPTDEMFFVQSAGNPATGTGLNKSAIIMKVSLKEAAAVANQKDGVRNATIVPVPAEPPIINPNGGTNWKGKILFSGEGMGPDVAPALYAMDPVPPYNSTILINNYYGRQFNSLNDVAVHPVNGYIYFVDVTYGFLQNFRPQQGIPNQIYRFNPRTKAITVVADDIAMPNGLKISPDGRYAYVSNTAAEEASQGFHNNLPSAIYRYEVTSNGLFQNRMMFAYVETGVPDGIHFDSEGNVYSGCGDGVRVWNPDGVLLGKIFLSDTSANFAFAGAGRMMVLSETRLYYATLAAKGSPLT